MKNQKTAMHACYSEIWKQNTTEIIIKFERLCLSGEKQQGKKKEKQRADVFFLF